MKFRAGAGATPLLQVTDRGLYCSAGDFFIDPGQPVARAVITHAHSDHARRGSKSYLATPTCKILLQHRLAPDAAIQTLPYGEELLVNDVRISFHPAGHILGSAQIRVERGGEVWVVSGDYKIEADPACEPFELVRCQVFITESTFGLPIYRWDPSGQVFAEINRWWKTNQEKGQTSILFCYAVGKAQRLLAGLDPSIGPLLAHGAISRFQGAYELAGIRLPKFNHVEDKLLKGPGPLPLVLAPPSAAGTPWLRKFGEVSTAFASGWMQIRGAKRRRALDKGFVLSDHADWEGLLKTIKATGASHIGVTHGYVSPMVRYLRENGWQAEVVPTHFEGEVDDAAETVQNDPAAMHEEPAASQSLFDLERPPRPVNNVSEDKENPDLGL